MLSVNAHIVEIVTHEFRLIFSKVVCDIECSLQDPRPHISLAWASGDISNTLKNAAIQEERRLSVGGSRQKCFFSSKFNGIECKIGNKTYKICKFSDK